MDRLLPIWELHSEILLELQNSGRLVLAAPTGSGKSTQVPQMLLEAGIAGRIIVLEPRRVAARSLAARVAYERGVPLGSEVGYQVRFEDAINPETRLCYVTEGIMLRWMQDDPELSGVSAVLFDEFHERNLLSDLALGLIKRLQETRRPDLKLAVMSATLDTGAIAGYLSHDRNPERPCRILASEGRMYPVEVRYLPQPPEGSIWEVAAEVVAKIVQQGEPGDLLIFMPGMGEINATIYAIRGLRLDESLELIPLHGDLPPEEQDRAFAPSARRKVVVATNVAETSITIDGIRFVIDSGLARIARYDAERGIQTLFVEEISRASADQRRGRAGRTAPGICYRLWTESGQLNRQERNSPEIQRSDLAEVVLLLHSLGVRRAGDFDWLDRPEPAAVERAEKLLHDLGALIPSTNQNTRSGSDLTRVGRKMLRLPMHPRYSRMLVEAERRGCAYEAALCAALASGRDLLVRVRKEERHIAEAQEEFEVSDESDFFTLIEAFRFARDQRFQVEACRRRGVHAATARQVELTHQQLLQILKVRGAAPETSAEQGNASSVREQLQRCIIAGFVDQLCVRRDLGTLDCNMAGGREGVLMRESVVSRHKKSRLFVAGSVREISSRNGVLTLLGLATAAERAWLEEIFPEHISRQPEYVFDRAHRRVAAVCRTRFLDLVIGEEHLKEVDPGGAGRCLAEAYGQGWFELPLFNNEVRQLIARVNLVCVALPELDFPRFDSERINSCLAAAFSGLTLAKEAQAQPLIETFRKELAVEQHAWLDELAPRTVRWPDERQLKLVYGDPLANPGDPPTGPEIQVKLTECFALQDHPRVCEGRVPVRLWLLAPDGKRLESTIDWTHFRAAQYPKLRQTLLKKYPGVAWL